MTTTASAAAPAALGRRFLAVWASQTLSNIGSTLSGVGIGIWVFLESGSAAWLGVLVAVANLPAVLVAPLVKHVDRVARRTVMIWGDVLAASGTVIALVLAALDRLELWHLAAAAFVGGIGTAFQAPAFQAAVPTLVEPEVLGRANSLNQFGPALGIVVGPILAAPLVAWFGLEAVLIVDVVTFVVAVVTALVVHFGERPARADDDDGSWRVAREFLTGPGRALLVLVAVMAFTNLVLSMYSVSLVTLSVEIGGAARSGLVLGAGGAAMLVGSIVLGAAGLPRRRVRILTWALFAFGAGSWLSALRPSLVLLGVGAAIAMVSVPAVQAAVTTIFHERVPASMQGRVFGLRFAIGQSLGPVGSLVAGFAIASIAEPAMGSGAMGERSVGWLIGTGRERGAALLLLGVGLALVLLAVVLARSWINDAIDGAPDGPEGLGDPDEFALDGSQGGTRHDIVSA